MFPRPLSESLRLPWLIKPSKISSKLKLLAMGVGLLLACLFVGVLSVQYGEWVGDKLARVVILPGAIALGFLLLMDKRKLLLLLLLIRAPIDPLLQVTRGGGLSPGAIMNALILLIAILLVLERYNKGLRTVVSMWLPLVLIIIYETAFSPDLLQGVRTCLSYFTYLAVFTAAFYLQQCQKDMRYCINLLLLSSVIPTLYGFVDFANGGYGGAYGNRVASMFPHPNIFAFYLVLMITLAFYAVKSPIINMSSGRRKLLVAYIVLMVVNLILTKTRSAWAACFLTFVVYGIMFERRYLIYIIVGSVIASMIPEIQDRLSDLNTESSYWNNGLPLNSYDWRKMLWESAWAWMKPSGIPLGYGIGSFAFHAPDFFRIGEGRNWSAHSVYYQWLFEAGVVGLLCGAWLYFKLLVLLRAGARFDRLGSVTVISIVVGYLVMCYSDNMLDYLCFNWYYWFLLGTACSIIVTHRSEEEAGLLAAESASRRGGAVPSGGTPGLTASSATA